MLAAALSVPIRYLISISCTNLLDFHSEFFLLLHVCSSAKILITLVSNSQGESMEAVKKQCTNAATKKTNNKQKTSAPPKDPQSIAAKVCFNLKQ